MSVVCQFPNSRNRFDNASGSSHDGNGGSEPPTMPPSDYVTHSEFQDFRRSVDDKFAKADERFARVETRLDQTASKSDVEALRADVHEGFSSMIKWVVGSIIGLGVSGIAVMTFVLNNAVPKNGQGMQPTPVIINVPAQSPPNTLNSPAAQK